MNALRCIWSRLTVVCAAGFLAFPAWAGSFAADEDTPATVARVAGAFILCVLAAIVGAVGLRRVYVGRTPIVPTGTSLFPFLASLEMGGKDTSSASDLIVRSRVRLNPSIHLCVVSFHAEELLLCVTPQGVSVLSATTTMKKDVA